MDIKVSPKVVHGTNRAFVRDVLALREEQRQEYREDNKGYDEEFGDFGRDEIITFYTSYIEESLRLIRQGGNRRLGSVVNVQYELECIATITEMMADELRNV